MKEMICIICPNSCRLKVQETLEGILVEEHVVQGEETLLFKNYNSQKEVFIQLLKLCFQIIQFLVFVQKRNLIVGWYFQ